MPEALISPKLQRFVNTLQRLGPIIRERVFKQVGKTVRRESLRMYRRTSHNWRHQPTFDAIIEATSDGVDVLVGTDDEIYGYVDLGTRPHPIMPKGPGYPLRFQWGGPGSYRAMTTPGVLNSRAGGASGPMVARWRVNHPGTAPRGFSEEIQKQAGQLAFEQTMKLLDKEIRRALR